MMAAWQRGGAPKAVARLTTILWAVVVPGLVRLASLVSNGTEAGCGATAAIVVVIGAAALAGGCSCLRPG
jgi:hypothetical protein